MVCTCNPGYSGKGDERCDLIGITNFSTIFSSLNFKPFFLIEPPREIGCSSDRDCPPSRACNNRRCVNPCVTDNPCSPQAICTPQNHQPECSCPTGMTGDPYVQCVPSKSLLSIFNNSSRVLHYTLSPLVKIGECRIDSECPDNRACIEHQCEDPCYVPYEPCGSEAKCEAIRHRAVCTCPTGWAGNPHDICFQCRFTSIIFNIIRYSR